MIDCTPLTACLACGSDNLRRYLDLGQMPLANHYAPDVSRDPPRYPLALNVCLNCSHSQLTHAVSPDLSFKDYPYVSGTSRTLGEYFDWFVEKVERDMIRPGLNVLDIGCNDGSLLERFSKRGHAVWGVDPAANLAPVLAGKGIPHVTGYWNAQTRDELDLEHGADKFDVIVAMNVLAHNADPFDFLVQCREALAPGGRVYIQCSQADFLANAEFDCVYHEHISYFTRESVVGLAARAGFMWHGDTVHPVHGGSLLVEFMASPAREFAACIFDFAPYDTMQERVEQKCAAFLRLIEGAYEGRIVIGYGAAAKGMTALNHLRLSLAYIADDNPLKQGKRAPLGKVKCMVRPPADLAEHDADLCVVILAWNFADEIIARVKALRPGRNDVFVQMFPHLRITR